MPGVSPIEAARLAERIRRQLESKKWMLGSGVALGTVTASFGVARRRAGESASDLFKRADAALYRAKVGRPQSRRRRPRRVKPALWRRAANVLREGKRRLRRRSGRVLNVGSRRRSAGRSAVERSLGRAKRSPMR